MRKLWVLLLASVPSWLAGAADIDFNRDVRPILSAHCIKCHGPDAKVREGGLRLDDRTSAVDKADSGKRAIVPGKPEQSELIARINHANPDDIMPPKTTNKPLTDAKKEILKQWIQKGAKYDAHWAFVPPQAPKAPKFKAKEWVQNPIDQFILAKLEAAGLKPNPPADRYTLARRLALDLTGLPPTPDEAEAFVKDAAPDAYEKYVDRLLASPHYGERWTRRWLDLARYADTNGYEKDRVRSMWPYRDWVINALNADMPFDQFTVEQIAGDMLPNATLAQRIATGFHRNTMINEEGGIDPQEFRYHSLVDRVNTTATVWLGLTLGCAQCHTHKFDPIPHKDYYALMAFMNCADEPELPVPQPDVTAQREEHARKIAELEAARIGRFPPEGELQWEIIKPARVSAESKAEFEILDDASVRFTSKQAEKDTYTVYLDSSAKNIMAVRVEALTDPALPKNGPGRAENGNFVLSEISIKEMGRNTPDMTSDVKIAWAEADFNQQNFPVDAAFDGKANTGWAIAGDKDWNVNRRATFYLENTPARDGVTRWTVRLEQNYGSKHTLGRLRLSLGYLKDEGHTVEQLRTAHFERKFSEWQKTEAARAIQWTQLKPADARSNMPTLLVQDDLSVLVQGDFSKSDRYELSYKPGAGKITAVRLETLPDERLPRKGPGRVSYEGPFGDFFLSELTLQADGKPVKIKKATQTFAVSPDKGAAAAIDGDPQTGWSINGGQGRTQIAVFQLETPLQNIADLKLEMLFERYYASGLGKFRISVTGDERDAEARGLTAAVEELLLLPADKRTPEQSDALKQHYLSIAPELAGLNREIQRLRDTAPAYPTTLVMQERGENLRRKTHIHHRGEFLQTKDEVQPQVLSIFAPLPQDAPHDRLTFARWLVSPGNTLTGRVTMNRYWAVLFGRGIVRTTEDFGFQGDAPTHPELLDWLALEFVKQKWSMKKMLKLLVMSATYQQASTVTADALQKDPENKLLSHWPRVRLDGELIRDAALRGSGLLTATIGGPSVFPPQPPGVTSEGAYGPLAWNVSTGADRYRRGLYTFAKRTAPYAMLATFDAPSGEACVARREVSNTPLQALTLLNDGVFIEAAQAAAKAAAAEQDSYEARIERLFRKLLTRPPAAGERALLLRYFETQRERLNRKELNAETISGSKEANNAELAAWALTARALLNLDEFVTKE